MLYRSTLASLARPGVVAVFGMLAAAGVARAQDLEAMPRVELGVGTGVAGARGFARPSVELWVTTNISERVAIEFVTDALEFERSSFAGVSRFEIYGLYIVQGRVHLKRARPTKTRFSIVFGMGGGYYFEKQSEGEFKLDDGRTFVIPKNTELDVQRPVFLNAGVSWQRPIGSRTAIRADVQALVAPEFLAVGGVAFRGTVGLAFALGGRFDERASTHPSR